MQRLLGTPQVGRTRQVVPGDDLPAGLWLGQSNNNLDASTHDGREWLAWRTAPSHFAGRHTRLHVVSRPTGEDRWVHELTIHTGRDLREPRLLAWAGRLFLYWFEAGTSPTRFEPGRMYATWRGADGAWAAPEPISGPGCVAWRARVVAGHPLMTVYRGGETIYGPRPEPTRVELWASDDGMRWEPLDREDPVVHVGGTETDLVETDDGLLVGVTRKEGPFGGWGSDILRAKVELPGLWETRPDPRKFDSPLVFVHGGRVLMVARRQLAWAGRYDLGLRSLPDIVQTRLYQGVYWLTRKRTALWRILPDTLEVEWLTDLPSQGDTAFAAVLPGAAPDEVVVYNYSSPLELRERAWLRGQRGETRIYATRVRL